MNVELGSLVRTRDGRELGKVDRLILNPNEGHVETVVVRKGFLLHRDVEVPLHMLATADDGTVIADVDDVDSLAEFHEAAYTALPPDYLASSGYAGGGLLWPVGFGTPAPAGPGPSAPAAAPWEADRYVQAEVNSALSKADMDNAIVDVGSAVLAHDGEKVGEVERLGFDADDGYLTHVVVRRGFLFHEDAELPASMVESVADGAIYLKAAAAEVRRLLEAGPTKR